LASDWITYSDAPSADDFRAIFSALDDATAPVAGHADMKALAVLLHDDKGSVIGGLWGHTIYSWLIVEMLVVPPGMRGHGAGSALMHMAEAIARRRGCIGIQVARFDFQAKGFYERLGFSVFGAQENMPPGHRQLYLCKRLDPFGKARGSAP
jgi:GNAT superfamily N-acetyltransferase